MATAPWARHLAVGVFLADMTGDGLLDVVSVRPNSVMYWPNKGNGKFGGRIVMTPPEGDFLLETTYGAFDPARVRFADLDGSGTDDLKASGREHAGGVGDAQRDHNDLPLWNLPHPNDAQALRRYEESYEYDLVGNLTKMVHTALNSAAGSWTRRYAYGNGGAGAPTTPANNRLHSTSLPGDAATGPFSATYSHDVNGNMVSMPHLAAMTYTPGNQMRTTDLGGGGTAYYVYDGSGERVRKVIQRIGTTKEERIYLGGFGLYRKRQGASQEIVLERETLHVMDDSRRIAMVETKTIDADVPGTLTVVSRVRYQYGNHLDSAHLECDGEGLVISYEEYHPYGTPAYRSFVR